MKKKILIVLLTFALFVLCICKSIPVDAKSNVWTSTGTPAIDINNQIIVDSIGESGCFFSFFDFCQNSNHFAEFLKLEFPESTPSDLYQKAIEKGYIDNDSKPSIVYITNEALFNDYLIKNSYMSDYSADKDVICALHENGEHILRELLYSDKELKAYIIYPKSIPKIYYTEIPIESSPYDKRYVFSELILPYVINGIWQYKSFEYDVPVENCEVLDLPNSIGKVKQISSSIFQYTYSKVLFDNRLNYYFLNQNETETVDLTKEQLPNFIFDSNGYLKDIYISKQGDLWTLPEVREIKKQIEYHYRIRQEFYYTSFKGSSDSGDDFYLFVAYLNFDVPIDTIEKIELSYRYWDVTQKYNLLKKLGLIPYKINDAKCTIYHDTKVIDPFSKKGKDGIYSYTNAITKSDYNVSSTHYTFRICLSDDNFVPKSYAENDYYTSYPLEYQPVSELQIVNLEYSYQSIIYNSKNLHGVSDDPDNNPNHEKSFLDRLWELILKLWNSSLLGKIVVIIVFILIALPFIYLLIILIKFLKKLFVNKKNKST